MIAWLQDRLAGRRFDWGAGNEEYTATVFGNWYVQRGQWAASVRWDTDETAGTVQVKLGPVGLMVTVARRRLLPPYDEPGTSSLKTRLVAGGRRELSTWRNWRHLGVCVEVDRSMWRVELGPFGIAAIPT